MEDCEDPEEAAAWAEMRAAFGDSAVGSTNTPAKKTLPSTASLDKSESADSIATRTLEATTEVEDEDAAWAALDKAFGKVPSKREAATLPDLSSSSSSKKPRPAAAPKAVSGKPDLDATDAWTQGEVDRLIGELQRTAGGPFTPKLLRELWSLGLEDQQDILLGCLGSCTDALESKLDRGRRLWTLVEEEVHARGADASAKPSQPKGAPPKATPLGKAPVGKAPVGKAPVIAKTPAAPKPPGGVARPGKAPAPKPAPKKAGAPGKRERSRSLSL